MKWKMIFVAALAAVSVALGAQTKTSDGKTVIDNKIEFDKVIHDFGDILISDGAKSTTFTLKNLSSEPAVILTVVSSCGCTDVKWTKEPIAPGKTGTIEATFSNDQGAYPFDKPLTVYISTLKKPVVIRLRGVSVNKKLPLAVLFPIRNGQLGFQDGENNVGNLSQGSQKSNEFPFANLGSEAATIKFANVSPGLSVSVTPNPVPPGSKGVIAATVTADRSRWGRNYYLATPVVNGKAGNPIEFKAFTKEDFSGMSEAEKARAAYPDFESSNFNYNVVPAGTVVEAVFSFVNTGKEDLRIYKVDTDNPKAVFSGNLPVVKPGKTGRISLTLDTSWQPKGEKVVMVTVVTNSPQRPYVNLFITGAVK